MNILKTWFLVASMISCCSITQAFSIRDATMSPTINNTKKLEKSSDTIVDRTKKMATDYLDALKKIMDASPALAIDSSISKGSTCSHNKERLVASDLSNYEQMVIMKKYPYLDLKELDNSNYHPLSHKNSRQSLHSGGTQVGDSDMCESQDNNGPNVDITNRGFSGFAIPTKALIKDTNNTKSVAPNVESPKIPALLLKSLEQDILNYEKLVNKNM